MLRLGESNERKKNNNWFWWKLREASLYTLECVSDYILKTPGLLDIESMFVSLCGIDCQCSNSQKLANSEQFLLYRALSLASKMGKAVKQESSLPIFQHAALTFSNGQEMTIPKIGACKMISAYFCYIIFSSVFAIIILFLHLLHYFQIL